MKRKNVIYIIYVCFILIWAAYFSLNILQDKGIISGNFISPLYTNASEITNENQSIVIDWNNVIKISVDYKNQFTDEMRNTDNNKIVNSEGFKDYNYSIDKPNNTFRIVALGDSFTEGAWISTNDTWPKQLERKLNQLNTSKFEVLNFGRGGAGTLEELQIFEENALKYGPDMVILEFNHDDWMNSSQERNRTNDFLNMYKNGSFKFPPAVEEMIKELNFSKSDISAIFWFMAIQGQYNQLKQRGTDNVWKENVETPLTDLISICKNLKIDLVVVSLDMNEGVYKSEHDLLDNFLTKYEIPFLDLTPYFPLEANSDLRLPDMHLNEKGYDLLSTKLLEFLIQSNKIRINR